MPDKQARMGLLRTASAAVFVLLPHTGRPAACLLLLILPLACECLRALGERTAPTLMAVGLALGVLRMFPPDLVPVLLAWCAASGAMMWLTPRSAWRRGTVWLTVCALCMLGAALVLNLRWQKPLAAGLAKALADWVNGRDNAPELLIRAYQNGLATLTPRLAKVPALKLGDMVVMTAENRRELLYSFRTTMERAFAGSLPQLICGWMAGTAVLCAAVPDLIRKRTGGMSDLPKVTAWYLPRGAGLAVGLLALGWLARMQAGESVMGYAGGLCSAMFAMIYGLQGAAAMLAQGMTGWRWAWMAGILVLCPDVFVIVGVIDQIVDPRGLRAAPEE